MPNLPVPQWQEAIYNATLIAQMQNTLVEQDRQAECLRVVIYSLECKLDDQRAHFEQQLEAERITSDRALAEREETAAASEQQLREKIEALRGKIAALESERGEEIRKAAARQDNEQLQKEVQQQLNEIVSKLQSQVGQLYSVVEDGRLRMEDLEKKMGKMAASCSAPAEAPPTCEGAAQLAAELAALLQRSMDVRNLASRAPIRGAHDALLEQTRALLSQPDAHAAFTPDLEELVAESERTLAMFK